METIAHAESTLQQYRFVPDSPFARLFYALNQERARSGKLFTVLVADKNGTLMGFCPHQWIYFMTWALTAAFNRAQESFGVVVRREEKLMDAQTSRPLYSVAGVAIENNSFRNYSPDEIRRTYAIDPETGAPLDPDRGFRYVDFNTICPGFLVNPNASITA